ncbi:hypothetical protein KW807_00620 [Candidatus Parcubacteria bacterium]|nr:hypothetical protein [Candidatus Parcubacteria bacterium]
MLEARRREVLEGVPEDSWYKEEEIALQEPKAERLKRFDDALLRLEIGQYGFCASCHQEIEEEWLASLPLIRICKRCDTNAEWSGVIKQLRQLRKQREKKSQHPLWQ